MLLKEHLNTEEKVDLVNLSFRQEQISQMTKHGAIFEQVKFDSISFQNCDMTANQFFDCSFENCAFDKSILYKSEFHNCIFLGSIEVLHSDCAKVEFNDSQLQGAVFRNSKFDWSFFNSCDLRNVKFRDVTLDGAILVVCAMFNSKFENTNLVTQSPIQISNIDFSQESDKTNLIQKEEFLNKINEQ
jgi:uncharacterized protein YjbI with pentapeptide repeats